MQSEKTGKSCISQKKKKKKPSVWYYFQNSSCLNRGIQLSYPKIFVEIPEVIFPENKENPISAMETEEKFVSHPKSFRLEMKMIAEKILREDSLSSHKHQWGIMENEGRRKICVSP